MINTINEGIKEAMKQKDSFRLNVLRMMKSKIMLVDARGEIKDEEAVKILKKYAKGLKETIAVSEEHGKNEAADEAKKELAVVEEFLPKELSPEQVKAEVEKVFAEIDEADKSNFGKVMSACMKGIKGADGALVKQAVNEILGKEKG